MRVGIVVPKYGHIIVKRNLLKRRLRELARVRLLPIPCSCDVMIRTLPGAYRMSFEDLSREIDKVARRLSEFS